MGQRLCVEWLGVRWFSLARRKPLARTLPTTSLRRLLLLLLPLLQFGTHEFITQLLQISRPIRSWAAGATPHAHNNSVAPAQTHTHTHGPTSSSSIDHRNYLRLHRRLRLIKGFSAGRAVSVSLAVPIEFTSLRNSHTRCTLHVSQKRKLWPNFRFPLSPIHFNPIFATFLIDKRHTILNCYQL